MLKTVTHCTCSFYPSVDNFESQPETAAENRWTHDEAIRWFKRGLVPEYVDNAMSAFAELCPGDSYSELDTFLAEHSLGVAGRELSWLAQLVSTQRDDALQYALANHEQLTS